MKNNDSNNDGNGDKTQYVSKYLVCKNTGHLKLIQCKKLKDFPSKFHEDPLDNYEHR